MIKCPSCGRLLEPRLTCTHCGSPLAADLDLFNALGLGRNLVIDPDALERAYHELGRRIHPDRFATAGAQVRDASLRATALLTRAYRTLRDPVTRGLYWLELNGQKLGDDNQQVPADLAELVFDVQAELAELRGANGRGASAPLRGQVAARRREVAAASVRAYQELNGNFAQWESDAADRTALMRELKASLSKIAYLRTLMRDIDRELDHQGSAR